MTEGKKGRARRAQAELQAKGWRRCIATIRRQANQRKNAGQRCGHMVSPEHMKERGAQVCATHLSLWNARKVTETIRKEATRKRLDPGPLALPWEKDEKC